MELTPYTIALTLFLGAFALVLGVSLAILIVQAGADAYDTFQTKAELRRQQNRHKAAQLKYESEELEAGRLPRYRI